MAMVMDTLVSCTTQSLGPFWRCFFLTLVMRKKYRTSLQQNWTHVDTCGHKLDTFFLRQGRLRVVRLVKNVDEQRLGVSKNWSS
jgi:hypothetical protein